MIEMDEAACSGRISQIAQMRVAMRDVEGIAGAESEKRNQY